VFFKIEFGSNLTNIEKFTLSFLPMVGKNIFDVYLIRKEMAKKIEFLKVGLWKLVFKKLKI
jgi:hypothetical protein